MRFLISILGPVLAFATPQLVFSIGAALLPLFVVMIFAIVGATALLCAATVSDGLFVAAFALWTLWCTGLWHGPQVSITGGFAHFCIGVAAVSALGPWLLVRNGFSVTQSLPLEEDSLAYQLLNDLCQEIEKAKERWLDPSVELPTEVVVPGDWHFAGQTAFISFHPGGQAVTATIPGGLWVVKGLWQWAGLTNPLAFNRNFMIVLLWSIACILLSRILPPVRTIRAMMSQKQIPRALDDVIETIRENQEVPEAGKVTDEPVGDEGAGNTTESTEEKEARHRRLITAGSTLKDGGMSSMTAYEPRLCRAPFECTWPKLKELAVATDFVVLAALSSTLREMEVGDYGELEESFVVLAKCTSALVANEDLAEMTEGVSVDEATPKQRASFFSSQFANDARHVQEATISWLNTIHYPPSPCPCTPDKLKNVATSYLPWIMPMVIFLKRMLITLSLPLRPKTWNISTCLQSFKFTLGFTILVIMEVYWVGYREFAIGLGEETQLVPRLYAGWHLLAYIFATTPTCEGSFKKGLQRAFGTVIGGFSAWLGLIVCSGSYDSDAEVNPYGLVTWLTVTTAVASFFTLEDGNQAFMGPSPQNGFSGLYYILTQSLIIMRVVVTESGTRNQIAVNRIVANLSGVAMAMIVAFIPPQVHGTDPEHIKALFRCERAAVSECADLLVDIKAETATKLEQVHASFTNTSYAKQKEALFLLKDSSKMLRLPIFKVDPRLGQYLESLTVLATAVSNLLVLAIHLAKDEMLLVDNKERLWFQRELRTTFKLPQAGDELRDEATQPVPENRAELEDFTTRIQIIDKRLDHYAIALAEIHKSSC